MIKYSTPITESDLHAYVDDQLSVNRRQEVEGYLEEHPEVRRELDDYGKLNNAIHDIYDPVTSEPIPDDMRIHGFRRRWLRVAAVIAWIGLGAVLGWSLRPMTPPYLQETLHAKLIEPAAYAHFVYASDTRHPVEIHANEEEQLLNWLSDRLHTSIRAPNLSQSGYELVGGRLLPSTDRMAAQFMYQNRSNQRVTLYIRRISGANAEPVFHYSQQQEIRTFYWIDGPLGYALSGALPKTELVKLARTAYRQQF